MKWSAQYQKSLGIIETQCWVLIFNQNHWKVTKIIRFDWLLVALIRTFWFVSIFVKHFHLFKLKFNKKFDNNCCSNNRSGISIVMMMLPNWRLHLIWQDISELWMLCDGHHLENIWHLAMMNRSYFYGNWKVKMNRSIF